MTLPTHVGVGTASETSVGIAAGHAVDDLILVSVEHPDGTITVPTGYASAFTIVHEATSVRLSLLYKWAASTSEANFPITGSALHNWGQSAVYRGVNKLNPFHVIALSTGINAVSQSYPGTTTLLQDCRILGLLAWAADSAGPLISVAPANSDLGSVTSRYDGGTTTSDGGGLQIWDGTLANKGAFSETSLTLTTSSATCLAVIALQAADQTFGMKSRIVNTGM